MSLVASLLILIVIMAVIVGLKFWNADRLLNSEVAVKRIATDVTFMQSIDYASRMYDVPSNLKITLYPNSIAAEYTKCVKDVQCVSAQDNHNAQPNIIIQSSVSGAEKICMVKSKATSGKIKLCNPAAESGCCEI